MREEKDIFSDLTRLCLSPGYGHIIAYFCFRDNVIHYSEELKGEDAYHQFSGDRLVRTEISTLIGLWFKGDIDLTLPKPDVFQSLIDETEALLKEMHQSMLSPITASAFDSSNLEMPDYNPFANGPALREPMFYGGESAYNFQYKKFSPKKYKKDDAWFQEKKGFSLEDLESVIGCIESIQTEKLNNILVNARQVGWNEWTLLPAFSFSLEEVSNTSTIDKSIVKKVVQSFSPPKGVRNQSFNSLNDFNITNAYPIIKVDDENYMLFQGYSLFEAFYETPFYWMGEDKSYVNEAMRNRGEFTEEFSAEALGLVFGDHKVFKNINILDSKRQKAGEIDVLVIFADRAIVLQAKSKRLTLEARKGNDNQVKSDFKKSIQDAYDQGLTCSKLLTDKNYLLVDEELENIEILREFKEIYVFCVVSDHYPALSFQVHQFLKYEQTETIMAPFVMDVFHLDVMCEMLQSPLYFLDYINKRSKYFGKIYAGNELTVLAYYLRSNLWLDDEYGFIWLEDDISVDLDISMMVRRQSIPGNSMPEGILTRFKGTTINELIESIKDLENSDFIDLGFLLLSLSEETVLGIDRGINTIIRKTRSDGKDHDLTVGFGESGLTIHCNNYPIDISAPKLRNHCELRKYSQRSEKWFGLCISSNPGQLIRFGINLEYPWTSSKEMSDAVRMLPKAKNRIGFKLKSNKKEENKNSKIQENKNKRKITKASRRKNRNK